MGLSKEELNEQFAIADKIKLLKTMQENFDYQAIALTQQELSRAAANKIPGFARFLKRMTDSGIAVTEVGEHATDFHNTIASEAVSHDFHFGGLVMATFDFFRVPFIYLFAYLSNQKIPINLNNNARWLYATLLLALTITAVAVPVTAPIIAFILAGVGFVSSLWLLGKTLRDRAQLQRENKHIKAEIKAEEEQLSLMQDEAKDLEGLFSEAKEESQVIDLCLEVLMLEERFKTQKKLLVDLKSKQVHIEQELNDLGVTRVAYKCIVFALACLAIAGIVTSLFFPPVGLGILATVALTSALCLLGRVVLPILKAAGHWLIAKLNPTPKNEPVEELEEGVVLSDAEREKEAEALDKQEEPLHHEQQQSTFMPHESTVDALLSLSECEHYHELEASNINVSEGEPIVHKLFPRPKEGAAVKKEKEDDDDEHPGFH